MSEVSKIGEIVCFDGILPRLDQMFWFLIKYVNRKTNIGISFTKHFLLWSEKLSNLRIVVGE